MNIKLYLEAYRKRKNAQYKSVEDINNDILNRRENGQSVKKVSDKYHTFEEYTDVRNLWFINYLTERPDISWKSLRHYDEDNDPISNFNGDFIAGVSTPKGTAAQHIKLKYWDLLNTPEIDHAPKYDGYTINDSIERIKSLLEPDPSIECYLGLIKVNEGLISKTSNDIEDIYKWFAMYPDSEHVLLHNRKDLDSMFRMFKEPEEKEKKLIK